MTGRTWGVEIECVIDNFYHDWSYEEGTRVTEFEDLFGNWDHDSEHCGIELKSPVYRGTRGFREIKAVCDWLKSYGADTTIHCGLHVHHGADDLTSEEILRVVKSWYQNQSQINLLVSSRRRTGSGHNEWCRGWTGGQIRNFETRVSQNDPYWYYSDRYKALNVDSLGSHGTIEIRQHEGTLDPEEIRSWVEFGQSFIESVAKKRKRALAPTSTTPILLNRIRTPKRSKDFYARKMQIASMRP